MRLRLLRAILGLSVLALVAACGSGSNGGIGSSKPSAGSAATAAPAPVKLTVSVGDLSPSYMKMFVAKDGGMFQRHGLDVDLQVIAGAQAVTAVVAGQIQIAVAGAGETLGADVGGADLVVIGTLSPGFSGQLWAAPNIK